MMEQLMHILRTDKDLLAVKDEYRRVLKKAPPGFNYDCYSGLEDYKNSMRKEILDPRRKNMNS